MKKRPEIEHDADLSADCAELVAVLRSFGAAIERMSAEMECIQAASRFRVLQGGRHIVDTKAGADGCPGPSVFHWLQ